MSKKTEDAPHEQHDAVAGVKSWLKKTGFPLQMRVTNTLAHLHKEDDEDSLVFVNQGAHYLDEEQQRWVESDVLVRVDGASDQRVPYTFAFSIECKNAPHPWVVLSASTHGRPTRRERTLSGVFPYGVVENEEKLDREQSLALHQNLSSISKLDMQLDCYRGISVTQAHTDVKNEQNAAYKAVRQSVDAARAFCSEESQEFRIDGRPFYVGVVPLVVTASPLMLAYTDASGSIDVEEIDCATIPYNHGASRTRSVSVHILSERYVSSLAEQLGPFCARVDSTNGSPTHTLTP